MKGTATGCKPPFALKLVRTSCIALLGVQPAVLAAALPVALQAPAAIAQVQSAEAVAEVAQAITVRLEGATQGSGVLVKRDGNRYTVLTAWHVVSGQRPGEELDIYTSDGQRHQLEQGSIKHLGDVDLAVLSFSSTNPYEVAQVGDVKTVSSGDQVFVAGFPSASNGKIKYDNANLIANAAVGINQGYQLLYSNETASGMSGGVVLKEDGSLIGIHGRGELDEIRSQQSGFQVKTGTNQGVPISYYKLYEAGLPVVAASTQATTADDYLVQAKALLGKKGSEQEVIRLANQALATRQSAVAYFYRAYAKFDLGDKQGAVSDLSQVISIEPQKHQTYYNRGVARSDLGDKQGALDDYNQAIIINPQYGDAFLNRGILKNALSDQQGAIADLNKAVALNPQDAKSWGARGYLKYTLGDLYGACEDMRQSASLGSPMSQRLLPQICQ